MCRGSTFNFWQLNANRSHIQLLGSEGEGGPLSMNRSHIQLLSSGDPLSTFGDPMDALCRTLGIRIQLLAANGEQKCERGLNSNHTDAVSRTENAKEQQLRSAGRLRIFSH